MTKGVDISEHNGNVNFYQLKTHGIDYVIIRCGYGSDIKAQDDSRFFENLNKAQSNKMPWGVYLYSYATNTDMAKSEARHVLRLLGGLVPPYGVWYDVEDSTQYGAPLTEICEAFCGEMEKAGLYCGIYSSLSWFDSVLNSPRLDRFDKWVAQWNLKCDYRKPYGMWQWTDRCVIGGKTFDANEAYKDYPNITKEDDDMLSYEDFKNYMQKYEAERAAAPASSWAVKYLAEAKEKGIMTGDGNGKLRPRSYLTREEAATMITRAMK